MLSTVPKSRLAIFSSWLGAVNWMRFSNGEPLLVLSVDGDSNLAARIIGGLLSFPRTTVKVFA